MIIGTGIADVAGETVRIHHHAQHLSAAGGAVLGGAGYLHSFRRQQVDHRSAIRLAGRQLCTRCIWDGWCRFTTRPRRYRTWSILFGCCRCSVLLRLKARDIVGYAVLQMFVHIPIVFFLCWLFAHYIRLCSADEIRERRHGKTRAPRCSGCHLRYSSAMEDIMADKAAALSQSKTHTRLSRQQITGFWAAWTGWTLDGMDSVIYALVLSPALNELLPKSGIKATPANVGYAGSVLFALFLVGWGLSMIWGPIADALAARACLLPRSLFMPSLPAPPRCRKLYGNLDCFACWPESALAANGRWQEPTSPKRGRKIAARWAPDICRRDTMPASFWLRR